MLCNNTVGFQFAKDSNFYWKTKHIKGHYHFVRNAVKTKEVVIKYRSTDQMFVGPLTKSIPRDIFKGHALSIRLRTV